MNKNLQVVLSDEKAVLPFDLAQKNQLLAKFLSNAETRDYLLPHLKVVSLDPNQVLYEHGDTIDYVYFPLESVASSLAIMEDGTTMETLVVGREGMVGVSAILGSGRSRQWFWVLIRGTAV